jgi:cytochrome c
MLKSFLLVFAMVLLAFVCMPMQGRSPQQAAPSPALAQEPPAAPPAQSAAPMKNPVKPTAESQARAKNVYQIDCAMCHGDHGNGKTDMATSMELKLDDWTNPASLANKTDGDLFTMIRTGKDQMPPEDAGRAKDSEVWNLIIYIRSFSKGQPMPAAAPAAPAAAAPAQ